MTHPCDLTALDARRLIGAKALSPVELMDSCLSRIAAINPVLNAIIEMDETMARDGAKAAEAAVMRGDPLGPLHGLPLALKDGRDAAGLKTTHGSRVFKDHMPEEDDPGVANLRAAGAIPFAKTNQPEFAAGGNTRNLLFGATGNPFDPALTPSGSSGGSAAALATAMVPLATGSDYGGSVRTPATYCGIAGFRPSLGTVPHASGTIMSPFGVMGAMGRTMRDTHLLLAAEAVHDPRDPFSTPDKPLAPPVPADLSSLRVAFSADLGAAPVSAEVRALFAERSAALSNLFAVAEEAAPDFGPRVHEMFEVTRGVAFMATHLEVYEKHRDQLDANIIENCERGLTFNAGEVAWGQREQAALYRRMLAFFERHDVLIAPAASVQPFPHSQLFIREIDGEAMPSYMRWLAITYLPTLGFCCAAVIPCGRDANGLPFGLQIIGPFRGDARVLSVALALEEALAGDEATARPLPDLQKLAQKA